MAPSKLQRRRSDYDVLVVGSGGAGLSAAIAAAEAGARVAVVTKGSLLYSGATASANFSYCARFGYFGAEDTAERYAADILDSGRGIADPELARIVAREAGPEAERLADWGLAWRRDGDGRFALANFAGHAFPRAIHVGLRTGKAVMLTLGRVARARNVDIREHCYAYRIRRDGDGPVEGLAVLDLATGETAALSAPAVVLATGGSVAMYALHTNPEELTGDGFALAYEAGAELVDMEFIQAYPTVFVAPAAARGLHYPTGRLLGHGAQLLNAAGEAFFHRHADKPIEAATRDEIARAIALELREGRGTPEGGILVDATKVPPERLKDIHFESYYQDLGIDLSRDLQHVTAAPHFCLGGIRIDAHGRTSVPGLFAAGEVAAGPHGANRLTGTALPEVLVMGRRAGLAAAALAEAAPAPRRPGNGVEALPVGTRDGAPSADAGPAPSVGLVADRLRATMQLCASVLKSADGLETALAVIDSIEADDYPRLRTARRPTPFDTELLQLLELGVMLTAARLHCLAAEARRETRGAHLRLDHPGENPEWRRHIVVTRQEGGPQLDLVKQACLS